MPSSSDRLPLIELVGELRRSCGETVPYNRVWRLAVEGLIPAVRERNRWYVDRKDVPLVAEALGLAAPTVGGAAPVAALA